MAYAGTRANWLRGFSAGAIESACAMFHVEHWPVRPSVWKQALFGKGKHEGRQEAIDYALSRFPSLVYKTRGGRIMDGITDAVCIALWLQEKLDRDRVDTED